MKKVFTLLAVIASISFKGFGQVGSYTFASSSGTYTPFANGTVLGTPSTVLYDEEVFFSTAATSAPSPSGTVTGTGISLGSNFTFNGIVYTKFAVNVNGFIVLGNTTTFAVPAYTGGLTLPISSSATGVNNIIAALAYDINAKSTSSTATFSSGSTTATGVTTNITSVGMLVTGTGIAAGTYVTAVSGTTITLSQATIAAGSGVTLTFYSTISYKVIGNSTVIQWAGYRSYAATAATNYSNFQVILNSTDNTVSISYGSFANTASASPQVGLRGITNADFNDRIGTIWASSTAGSSNSSVMTLGTTTPTQPASGLLYIFTPLLACTAPLAQPTALNLTSGVGTVTGSFTASASATGYLAVRTTGATPTAPVNGTTYTPGTSALGGTIISSGNTTTFTDNTTAASTSYAYWVYAYNNTSCSGGPVYLTSSPLTATTTSSSGVIKNWVGAGVSGGTGGTDFNTGTNWSPTGVPGANDSAIIATTSAAAITLSASVTIGYLNIVNNSAATVESLSSQTLTLTINNSCTVSVGSSGTSSAIAELLVGNSPGAIIINGNLNMGTTGSTAAFAAFGGSTSGTTGSVILKGNLTFGDGYGTVGSYLGSFILDKAGTQILKTGTTYGAGFPGNVVIGSTNTPYVQLAGPNSFLVVSTAAQAKGITVNAGCTLDLGTYAFNKSTTSPSAAGGTLTVANGATLKLAGTTGGQTGSNFPLSFTTATPVLGATSTVQYYAAGSQTIYNIPAYGNLTVGDATTTPATIATAGGNLTINGNVKINTSAAFNAGTSLVHTVGGDWTNNGAFSFTTANTIDFNGANALQTISGSSTTGFSTIQIDKNSVQSNICEVVSPITIATALTLTSGTFKLSGTFTLSNKLFSTTSYTIGANAGIWLNNPNVTVIGQGSSPTNNGLLRLTAGTYNIGTGPGNSIDGKGDFIIEGGVLNVTGRLSPTAAGTYTQSGGIVNVSIIGNPSSTVASFNMTSANVNASFTMTGGIINLVQASTGSTGQFDYIVSVASTITGGTLNIGTSATATNFNFKIAGSTPSIVINNTTTNKTATASDDITDYGDLTINSGTSLNANGNNITITGNPLATGNWLNNGTFTPGAGSVIFNNTTGTQNVNNGTSSFSNLAHSGAATLRITNSLTATGTFVNSAGTYDANALPTTITGLTTISGGTYNASSALQTLTGGLTVSGGIFSGSTGAVTTSIVTLSNGTLTAPSGTFSVSGAWTKTGGTFTPGLNTVTFSGSSNQNLISGNSPFYNIDHTGSANLRLFTNNLTLGGTFKNETGAGDYIPNNLSTTVAGLTTFFDGTFSATGSGTQTLTGGLLISSTSTYTASANTGVTTIGGNLTVSTTVAAGIGFGGGSSTVNANNIVLTTGIFQSSSGILNISGNFTNNFPGPTFLNNSGTIIFAGASPQILSGSNTNVFYNLTFNNGSGVTLSTAESVGNTLAVTSGVVNTNNGTLSVTNPSASAVSGGSATAFIDGPLNRTLPGAANTVPADVYLYPLGDGSTYLPFSITNLTTVGTTPTYQVQAFAVGAGGTPDNSSVTALSTTEYWKASVSPNNSVTNGSISLTRPAAVSPYNTIAYNNTKTGSYSSVGGTPSGTSINNSTSIGNSNTQYYVLGLLKSFTITATTGANGTVTPAGTTTVNYGGSQAYTITPAANYHVADVLVDGTSVGAVTNYTFSNVTANHTVSATFAINTFTITATTGANGTVTPPGTTTVNYGGSQTFTITPTTGYSIATVLIDGVNNPGAVSSGSYTFSTVTANHTITATYAINTYTITVTQNANGTIAPGTTTVNYGGSQAFTITPAANYHVADVLVDGASVGAVTAYTFSNVTANHTISATFAIDTYTITATSGANGTVTPAGTTIINYGGSQTYSITSNSPCYSIATVLIDGVNNPGAVSSGSYTFTNVTSSHTISATFSTASDTWTGATSTAWNVGSNWSCGVPTSATDASIPNGAPRYPLVSGSYSVRGITIGSAASLTIDSASAGVLTITGAYSNAGVLTNNGRIVLNGALAQTFPGGSVANLSMNTLEVSNTSGVTLDQSITIRGAILPTAGTLALGNNYITLRSDSINTGGTPQFRSARIGVDGSATPFTYGNGRFVIERYFHAKRAWRLITAPITKASSSTIFNGWQLGGRTTSSAPPAAAGSGVLITGNYTPTNGFDNNGSNKNPSLKIFEPTTGALNSVVNTKPMLLSPGTYSTTPDKAENIGYFNFVRGDRDPSLLTLTKTGRTTLRDTGIVQTGVQSFTFPLASNTMAKFVLLPNPYASPVDFQTIYNTNQNNIEERFYAWDPELGDASSVGGYVTYDLLSGATPNNPPGHQTQYIQSTQAVYLQTSNATTVTVTVNESDKTGDTINAPLFRPLIYASSQLAVNLKFLNTGNNTLLADGILAQFSSAYSDAVDKNDGLKFLNPAESFAFARDGKLLSIERRNQVTKEDTLFFNFTKGTKRSYQLEFVPDGLEGTEAYLLDSYLKTSTPVSMSQTSTVNFSITDDAGSAAADRFMIVFRPSATLPVTFTKVKAYQQGSNINVEWNIENEVNIKQYEVERSTDGRIFSKSITLTATRNNGTTAAYSWPDASPVNGANYYRIKSISKTGEVQYSLIVKVTIGNGRPMIAVYPNPITGGTINLQLTNQPAGKYGIRLLDKLGQVILSRQTEHSEGSSTESLEVSKAMAHGNYQLEVTKPDRNKTVINVVY